MLDDLLDFEDEDDAAELQGAIVGIDLGTTNSVACAIINGTPTIIADGQGHELHSSTVAWLPNGARLVGAKARLRRVVDPENTVFSAKRLIGQAFGSATVQRARAAIPYAISEGSSQEILVTTREGDLSVPQISSYVLGHLKALCEEHLGKPVTHCVVTVPANFSDSQRAATRKAASLAGMEVLRILNEPTAAAIAYGADKRKNRRIAIFDLGGGTFDVSVLAVRDNLYEVLATGGDSFLGGDDVDASIYALLAEQFLREHRLDPNADPIAKARLLMAAEQIKHGLSEEDVVAGRLNEITRGQGGVPLGLDFSISRAELEGMISKLVKTTMDTVDLVLAQADLAPTLIDEVILVGGSTRIPMVQRLVDEKFGKAASSHLDPMKVVAIGAALQAQRLLNPTADSGVLLDVTPHSLRVATVGGFTKVLIAKNATIPAEGSRTFFAAREDQESVTLRVCQGEEELFADNVPLGELVLDDLPKGKRGEVGVQVEFTIDADGILQVSARETASNKVTHATLAVIGLQESR